MFLLLGGEDASRGKPWIVYLEHAVARAAVASLPGPQIYNKDSLHGRNPLSTSLPAARDVTKPAIENRPALLTCSTATCCEQGHSMVSLSRPAAS